MVYRCIKKVVEDDNTQADITNVSVVVQRKDICPLYEYMEKYSFECYSSVLETHRHIDILKDYNKRRQLYMLSQELKKEGLQVGEDIETVVGNMKNSLDKVLEDDDNAGTCSMREVLSQINTIVLENKDGKNEGARTHTGFKYIDDKGGFISTDLIIIAGATSMGKTSFADSVVLNAIETGSKVLFFSLEMSKEQLTARMLARYTKLNSRKQLYGKLTDDELKAFDLGVDTLYKSAENLFFDDKSSSKIDDICASIRKHKAKYDIKGVVVDYLQLVGGQERGENVETFLARIARKLKNLAKDLSIWIVALSQIHRDKDNYVPTLNMIRGSGQIAEAADVILLLYRPEYYNFKEGKNLSYPYPYENIRIEGTAMVIQAKGRNDGDGSFVCGFSKDTTHFFDYDELPRKDKIAVTTKKEEKNVIGVGTDDPTLPF